MFENPAETPGLDGKAESGPPRREAPSGTGPSLRLPHACRDLSGSITVSTLASSMAGQLRRTLKIARELPVLLQLDGPAPADARAEAAKRLYEELSTLSADSRPAQLRWFSLHVLECLAVRRRIRVSLVDWLAREGVFRKLNDLVEPSGGCIGLLIALALLREGLDKAGLPTLMDYLFAEGILCPPNSADAMTLQLLHPRELVTLRELAEGTTMSSSVELACWFLDLTGRGAASIPAWDPVVRDWFETRAWRGPRRQRSRQRGKAAAGAEQLERCLLPPPIRARYGQPIEPLPESYGAMIVEWTLSAARARPNQQQAKTLQDQVAEILTGDPDSPQTAPGCENANLLIQWLEKGVEQVHFPEGERGVARRRGARVRRP